MNKLTRLVALLALAAGLSGTALADGGTNTAGGGHTNLLGSLLGGAHPNDGTGGMVGGGHGGN